MAALIVLFGSLILLRLLGVFGVTPFSSWHECARYAIATMFAFTAISHFAPMRKDLAAMVPRSIPHPDIIVFTTGILELAGAVGLVWPRTRLWAGWGLIALLVAMFPANVSAARRGVALRGRLPTPIPIRIPMQFLFIAWTWWVR